MNSSQPGSASAGSALTSESVEASLEELVRRHERTLDEFRHSLRTSRPVAPGEAATAIALAELEREIDALRASLNEAATEVRRVEAERDHFIDVISAERVAPQATDPYVRWRQSHDCRDADISHLRRLSHLLSYRPTFSILMPTYETDETFLRAAIDSVLRQAYPFWQLCIADDASPSERVRSIVREYAAIDPRVSFVFREHNGHISEATNSALAIATGEYVVLFDHDDLLAADALFHNAVALAENPSLDMVYSDEDKIREDGTRFDPFFKPEWCPDSLLSRMYTSHLAVYRTSLAREIGGFRVGFEGSQDYDFVLRFTERSSAIAHIPRVLYHWRVHARSTASTNDAKPYARNAAVRAIGEALERRGEPGSVNIAHDTGVYIVRYDIRRRGLVSVIVPTRDHGDDVDRCLSSLFARASAVEFEVLIVDNGSSDAASLATFDAWANAHPAVRVLRYDKPFNFSAINNFAARNAKGDYLLFLNNDTEVISADILAAMVEQAQRPSIGAVGAMLLYPDETIQHAGVIVGLGGVAGHSHKYYPGNHPGYFRMLEAVNNYTAVTAACLMLRREVFEEVSGLDETLAVAFNDVDFCLRIAAAGYRNVCLPHVRLHHYESKSRGHEDSPDKVARFALEVALMRKRWNTQVYDDPCYSPNLTRDAENFALGT